MKSIHDYITEDLVTNMLCDMRVRVADQIHKKELFSNLYAKGVKDNEIITNNSEIYSLLPSRKQWKQLKKNFRQTKNGQVITTHKKNVLRLKITIAHYRKTDPSAKFLINLDNFIRSVCKAFTDKNYRITSPKTFAVVKDRKTNNDDKIECRPISMYSNLLDRIVIKITNKYLSELFDPYFCHCDSLAFRTKRTYYGEEILTTHHHAVDRINAFRKKYNSRNIYVSECDIKKFYDSVDHLIVKQQFKYFLAKAKKDNRNIDSKAIRRIFISYLNSFSFPKDVFSKNTDTEFWKEQNEVNGYFKWIDKELIEAGYYSIKSIRNAKIGVPQGGAISGLIANMVLDFVDEKIQQTLNKRMLYIRYCDDMILLSTNKQAAIKATTRFINTLTKDLKLIPHKPEIPEIHDKKFWDQKSKRVYKWESSKNTAPWIGFVGYEFRRTGELRIRKKSLNKELKKQRSVFLKIFRISIKPTCKSKGTLLESLSNRLIGMSIGRVSIWNYRNFINELCWIVGFKKLPSNKYSSNQIKQLDKNRSKYLFLAAKRITTMNNKDDDKKEKEVKMRFIPKYYGLPFSYYFHNLKNKQS